MSNTITPAQIEVLISLEKALGDRLTPVSRFLCTFTKPGYWDRCSEWVATPTPCGVFCMPGDPSLCQKHGGQGVRFMTSGELKSRGWTAKQIAAFPPHGEADNPYGGRNRMRVWLAPIVIEIEQARAAA